MRLRAVKALVPDVALATVETEAWANTAAVTNSMWPRAAWAGWSKAGVTVQPRWN